MPGVDPKLAIHRLHVKPGFKPVIQKGRRSVVQHTEAVVKEVENLLEAKAIREVQYPEWLSNTVVDLFPLPKIDQFMDMTSGMSRMSFLDAYRGYHQIPMHPSDRENTSFITPKGIFCYQVMPLGLKNAGATFQRMVTTLKTMEVYIDDMWGIEADLTQIKAIQCLERPTKVKEIQKLTGTATTLNRFMSRSSDRFRPFFQLLKSGRAFQWDDECEAAFLLEFKSYLQKPQLLATPKEGDTLQLYMAVSDHAISVVILREERKVQYPIYYVSKTMLDAETSIPSGSGDRISIEDLVRKSGHVWKGCQMQRPEEANQIWKVQVTPLHRWELQIDGSSTRRGSGAGIVLIVLEGEVLEMAIRLGFPVTNNEAEYEALFQGVQNALRLEAKELNDHADALATLASADQLGVKRVIQVEVLERPSIDELPEEIRCAEEQTPSWMDPIVAYLKDGILPEDKKEARKLTVKATRFLLSPDQKLYKKSFSDPYLLCVHPGRVDDLLFEIHEGSCGAHAVRRTFAFRTITQGFWWPYMQKDALQYGLDIVEPLPQATGNRRFLITATDYFTKWIEAKPLAAIRDIETRKFVWENIITSFQVPNLKEFCGGYGIKNLYSTPAYPKCNSQAEAANKIILDEIKRRLVSSKGMWVEELRSVLWAYRTTPRRSTRESPFVLAYGAEVVIPLEIGLPTL
ncbi:uncharacterized protein LOC119981840 [Tripterygium wilfordii]|uniref:uncharacterized protein LOC119981840 n=1 Tax=Tripterygium wilfordii TaxID=458696 RepID=UPI0018F81DC4|nr:uncharacterized protein LOC119981840 [Tripterygium wilfordii]